MTLTSSSMDLKTSVLTSKTMVDAYPSNEKEAHTTSSSLASLRSLLFKYFQRNRTTQNVDKTRNSLCTAQRKLLNHDVVLKRPNSNENYRASDPRPVNISIPKASLSSSSNPSQTRSVRQKTTATFIGQKRNVADMKTGNRFSNDLVFSMEEEQHLVRTRLSTRTSSLPAARCVSYYYYQPPTPPKTVITKAIIEDQHRDSNNNSQRNSLTPARSRSQSHSSDSMYWQYCHGSD